MAEPLPLRVNLADYALNEAWNEFRRGTLEP